MNLHERTKELCKLYGIKPARSKGQNFLIEEAVFDRIVAAANLTKEEIVLEVGPGLGFMTAKLARQAKQVVAVELDDKLAEVLKVGLALQGVKNIEVVNRNVLDMEVAKSGYKIVANLPYNITSVFIRKFLETPNRPELMVLMLQKEVAERIAAKPGEMSLLAVSVQFYAEAEVIEQVPAKLFWPAPEVDSAVIRIRAKKTLPQADERDFFRLVKFGFSAKRKMLKNNLAGGYHISQTEAVSRLKEAGIGEKARAEDLSLEDWLRLLPLFKI